MTKDMYALAIIGVNTYRLIQGLKDIICAHIADALFL